jgi:hypothetical protein
MVEICSPQVGPFCGVFYDHEFTTGGHGFRVVAYRAYNAMGLIGSECNGIALLSDTNKDVVFDEHFKATSGYAMDDARIMEECVRIARLDAGCLHLLIAASSRARYMPEMEQTCVNG